MFAEEKTTLANITRLPLQWKIILDFNPMDFTMISRSWETLPLACVLGARACKANILRMESLQPDSGGCHLFLDYTETMKLHLKSGPLPHPTVKQLKSNQLPKNKEWYRLEITQEEEEDSKYYISFSVNGKESDRREVSFMPEILYDVKITSGGKVPSEAIQPGLIRRLVVLEKDN